MRLSLVPSTTPYGWVLAALAEASGGRYQPDVRETAHDALCAIAREMTAAGVGPDEIAVVGRWSGLVREVSEIGGDPRSRLSVWVAGVGNILRALADARDHEREASEASAHLAELKKTLGYA